VITSSLIENADELQSRIRELGGHFVDTWSQQVTHVVMDAIKLTQKAMCALLAGEPIVTPKFITELLVAFHAADKNAQARLLSNVDRFLPPRADELVSVKDASLFFPKPERSNVFRGKIFLFCSNRHMKSLKDLIILGGT